MQQRLEAHDLTDTQLEEGYWVVTHWKKIERGLIFFLYVVIALTFGFSLVVLLKIFAIDRAGTIRMADDLKASVASYGFLKAVPADITVEPPVMLASGSSRYALVQLRNSNEEWMAQFDLVLSSGGAARARRHVFLYPRQSKYSVQEATALGDLPTASVENIAWTRLSAMERNEIQDKKRFTVDEFSFIRGDGVSRTRFTIKNESVHSYWNVEIPVVLFSGGTVTAADSIILGHIDAGEAKQVWATFSSVVSEPSATSIEPDVNIFDSASYRGQKAPLQRLR